MVGFVVGAIFAILSYLFYVAAVAIIGFWAGYAGTVAIFGLFMDPGFVVWLIAVVVGVLLAGVVLRFNLPALPDKVARMADVMGLQDKTAEAFVADIEQRLDEIGIPSSLSDIGVPLDCAERIAAKALQDSAAATNPRAADLGEVRALVEAAITKAR